MHRRIGASNRLQLGLELANSNDDIVDALASQLRLRVHGSVGYAGADVLRLLIPQLEWTLEDKPGHWITDALTDRAETIVAAALEDLDQGDAERALIDLGFGTNTFPRGIQIQHVDRKMRELLRERLVGRVGDMLDRWRDRDLWNPDLRLGIVKPRSKREW